MEKEPLPRKRRNDPVGVSDAPAVVTDPARVAELVREYKPRLGHIFACHELAKQTGFDRLGFNELLKRLQNAVRRMRPVSGAGVRLHPALEIEIARRARKLAGLSTDAVFGTEHDQFVQQAGRDVAASAKSIRGRSGQVSTRHCFEGLVALIQETTGKPVRAPRHKDSVYEPQLLGPSGEALRVLMKAMDPSVSETTMVNWICALRRKYAGKPMRFGDFFPGYGATMDAATGVVKLRAPYRLVSFEPSAPISCP